ncbi:hypothetical protein QBC39DRAFT_93109 [Podospora conica]|nr:hypothetical protein QBC39DRAFT_93109 [Schizothecium conicum]
MRPITLLLGALPLALARDPLNQILSSLLFTLYSHDPTTLTVRLSPFLISTENNIPTPLGTSSLWQHAIEPPPTDLLPWGPQHRHVDFATMQAVAVTTILENDVPAILVVRVRITKQNELNEVETMVVRDDVEGARGYRAVADDSKAEMGPESEEDVSGGVWRIEEARVGELVGAYFQARDKGESVEGMFAEGCYRVDNGRVSEACELEGGGVYVPWAGQSTRFRGRRLVVHGTDVARQGAFSFATVDVEGEGAVPRSWLVAESVRLDGKEKIDRVELIWTEVAYGSDVEFKQAEKW